MPTSVTNVAQQSHIRDNIIEVIVANPAKSFEQIAHDIGNWCSVRTLVRSVDFSTQRLYYIRPARTAPVDCSSKTKAWCLRHAASEQLESVSTKNLWINYEEKEWFYGCISQCNAKMCEVLGIKKTLPKVSHQQGNGSCICRNERQCLPSWLQCHGFRWGDIQQCQILAHGTLLWPSVSENWRLAGWTWRCIQWLFACFPMQQCGS